MVVLVMGVSGAGKTTVGRLLAMDLGWTFLDADDFHPAANVAKMHAGIPLTDEDRRPWLEALRRRIAGAHDRGESVVLACSALKHNYQHFLEEADPGDVRCVFLEGPRELIRRRLEAREGHFMSPALLDSQFAALEPPDDAVRVDVSGTPEQVASVARAGLGL